jgi:hypothetical protein
VSGDRDLIAAIWTGEAFEPTTHFMRRRAAEAFGSGEVVLLAAEEERSARNHNHQFAAISEAWQSLPESLAHMPFVKSAESLRKHALIATGWGDTETIVTGSKAAAERVAAYVGLLAHRAHGYAIVEVSGPVVKVHTPQSQSRRAMSGGDFTRSKQDCLGWIEALLAGARAEA